MVKDKISVVVSNLKLSISSSKISPNIMKEFSMPTIDNKYARNVSILQSLLKVSIGSISISNHSFCWKIENFDTHNESNKSEIKTRIKLKNKMNQDKLICQIKKTNS